MADFSEEPLRSALQGIVQPKLVEFGWTTDPEDSNLFEYILLMLLNNKDEAQIASELSNDLLDLGPDNPETQQFARWLFDQINMLRGQLNGNTAGDAEASHATGDHMEDTNQAAAPGQDTEMGGAPEPGQGNNIPTGPKAMRNGSGPKAPRSGRMLNQLNRQLDRQDDSALHRVRGTSGTGRINSHSREPPKGPRNSSVGRGVAAMANGRGLGNANLTGMNMGHGGMNNGMNMGGMGGMPVASMGQNQAPTMLNAQQQMALMQMYEQQAHMMQQIFAGATPTALVNPNFQGAGQRNPRGRSTMDRVNRSSGNKLPMSTKFSKEKNQDETMADGGAGETGDGMDVDSARDSFSVMCKFNLRCSKVDCPFAHQSPAAPDGQAMDMTDTCSYGVACKNRKCAGRHPSPAKRGPYKETTECIYFPNCTNQNCPYKHPAMPPCRNGADCTVPGCKFWHNTVMCKFNPCTNRNCPYKHAEGQQKVERSRVWIAPKGGEGEGKDHVSERKFVDENAPEELIIPGKADGDTEITT